MKALGPVSCLVLVLTSCIPEKRVGLNAVVGLDTIRMDDSMQYLVTALSRQIRTGFELGTLRENTILTVGAQTGPGRQWPETLASEPTASVPAERGMHFVALAEGASSNRKMQPFRFRATNRSAGGKIGETNEEGTDGRMTASGPLSVLRNLLMPVVGIDASGLRDTYGSPRSGHRIHGAIDIHAPLGTPVVASIGGTVWKVRWDVGGGRTVHLLDESGKYVFYYAHLSRYAKGLHEGQSVQPGDLLGYVGRSGDVRGSPHLHLRIGRVPVDREHWWDTKPLNPYPLLKSASTVLP